MASIRQRRERWQARVSRRGFASETKTFSSRQAAARWARSIEAEMDRGAYHSRAEADRVTLKDVLHRYVLEVSPDKRGGRDEAIRLRAMARSRLARHSMPALSAATVAGYRDERLQVVAPSTVLRDLAMLSSVINHSRREWNIGIDNPVARIRKPSGTAGRIRVLELHEEAVLLDAAVPRQRRNHWVRPMIIVALETAMRRGELLALRWPDVDLQRRVAHLHMTKNGKPRTVPLSTRALQTLVDLPRSLDGRVFPITHMALHAAFRKAVARAKLEGIRFHDLRHTATSRLANRLPNVI